MDLFPQTSEQPFSCCKRSEYEKRWATGDNRWFCQSCILTALRYAKIPKDPYELPKEWFK